MHDNCVTIFRKFDVNRTGRISSKMMCELLQMLDSQLWPVARILKLLEDYGQGHEEFIQYEDFFRWLFVDNDKPLHSQQPSLNMSGIRVSPKAATRDQMVRAEGSIALHVALKTSQPVEISKTCLQECPEGAKLCDSYGTLPIHMALTGDGASSSIIDALLEIYPEGAGIVDEATGMLPIHLALMQKRSEELVSVLKVLLKAYPEGSTIAAPSGDKPIQLAVYLDHGPDVMEEILKAAWLTQMRK